jgi:uncharacterized protein (TIGR04255 family)
MKDDLHLKKAPITEAVIEIRLDTPSGVTLGDLNTRLNLPGYTTPKNKFEFEGMFEFGETVASTKSAQKHIGYVYTHETGKQILQVGVNSFSLSCLAPYVSWNVFCGEARCLWEEYSKIVMPSKVVRLAVRYINRIDIPLPVVDLRDYLKTYPEVPSDLIQSLSGYFMRIQSEFLDMNARLVLHQAMVPPSSPDVVSVLLDIDLIQETNISLIEDELWESLEVLRNKKNEIFLGCLTEKTLRLFSQ